MAETISFICDILLVICVIQLIFTCTWAFTILGNLLDLINCKFINGLGVISAVVAIPVIIQVRNELETALISKTYGKTIWYQRYALCMCIILYSAAKFMAVERLIWTSEATRISEFSKLMKVYLSTVKTKRIIDRIQILLHCCGSNNYTDWFTYDWTSRNITESNEILNENKQLDLEDYSVSYNYNKYNMDVVPFSCCSVFMLEPCKHDDLQMHGNDSIYLKGCGKSLEEFSIIFTSVELIWYTVSLCLEAIIMILLKRKKFAIENENKSKPLIKSILKKTPLIRKK